MKESDESPGGRAGWVKRRRQSRVLWHMQGLHCPPLQLHLCQPGASCSRTIRNAFGQCSVPQTCATRNRELCCCLTKQPASSFYTWFPRKLNELKRSIAVCFEVLNLSFPVSPAGTKLIKWRQSAWFSWYPTAVTILLPELLTHAAMQQESYFSMKYSQERFIALQKSSTEPSKGFAKCSPALQCCGCFTMGMGGFVAQSIDRGSTWTPTPQ